MEKRPLSLTIIGWVLVVFTLFGIYGLVTLGSNPMAAQMLAQTHVPLVVDQGWGLLGAIVNLACAYGILKGQPWSRVLYVVWGVISLVVGLYISPIKYALILSLILIVVFAAFLWTNTANEWFSARGFMLKREPSR